MAGGYTQRRIGLRLEKGTHNVRNDPRSSTRYRALLHYHSSNFGMLRNGPRCGFQSAKVGTSPSSYSIHLGWSIDTDENYISFRDGSVDFAREEQIGLSGRQMNRDWFQSWKGHGGFVRSIASSPHDFWKTSLVDWQVIRVPSSDPFRVQVDDIDGDERIVVGYQSSCWSTCLCPD